MFNFNFKGPVIFLIVAFIAIVLIAYGIGRSSVSEINTSTRLQPDSFKVRQMKGNKGAVRTDTVFTYKLP